MGKADGLSMLGEINQGDSLYPLDWNFLMGDPAVVPQ
jgi:hypothetical protein